MHKTHKISTRNDVIGLRKKGLSYSEIRRYIHLPKSTLSRWLRSVVLSEIQHKKLVAQRFRGGLEYILKTDSSREIPIHFAYSLPAPVLIIPEYDQERLKVLQKPEDAKYILNNYRFQNYKLLPHEKEFYAISVERVKVMSVFKMYHE